MYVCNIPSNFNFNLTVPPSTPSLSPSHSLSCCAVTAHHVQPLGLCRLLSGVATVYVLSFIQLTLSLVLTIPVTMQGLR